MRRGYLDQQGPNELLVRALGRIQSIEDLQKVVVTIRDGRPVALAQVAQVMEGPQVKRGTAVSLYDGKANRLRPNLMNLLQKQSTASSPEGRQSS